MKRRLALACALALTILLALPGLAPAQGTYLSAPDGKPARALAVDNNGRVGIGTTNPQSLFHVFKAAEKGADNMIRAETAAAHRAAGLAMLAPSGKAEIALGGPTYPAWGGANSLNLIAIDTVHFLFDLEVRIACSERSFQLLDRAGNLLCKT